jgi:uncharacterized protein (TIGR00369 family)
MKINKAMQQKKSPENTEGFEKRIQEAVREIEGKFGIHFPEAENGKACGELILQPQHRNLYGIPYGGVMFNLADNTAGMAFLSAGGNGITVSGNVNYLRGASPEADRLICWSSVKKAGRRLFFLSAEVSDNFGTLLSEYSFVFTNLSMEEK